MKLWPGYWENQIDRMNKNVDEENGRGGTKFNGNFWKLRRFSKNEFWKNIRYLLSAPTIGIRGLRLEEKDTRLSVNIRKRSLIRLKDDFYEVCASLFQIVLKLFLY